ncbi:MAG: DUF411 domain-containing protein [Rhodocyclaceae bacterium]|nr:DUF411 domain-containing protein [Rhodocyclaceae bacterium]MDZ4214638.1 DUF411 domain-containing protein [Rhodocyclaceae bacterium]
MRAILWMLLLLAGPAVAEILPPVKVFVPKVCLACIEWAEHLRQHGFTVTLDDSQDMAQVKKRYRIGPDLEARHTAVMGDYVIEGHVPAEDIKLLLKERPKARGLAVPGAPRGAPGLDALAGTGCETGCTMLEGDGAERIVRRELYNTLLIGKDGKTSTYARH